MKKLLLSLCFIISINCFSQSLDTVSDQTLILRSQDWAWLVGKFGQGVDSLDRAIIRSIRTQVLLANPATWNTNVTITGLKGRHIIWMYAEYSRSSFNEILNLGSNNAERTTIYTNIRALTNSAIQYNIGLIDTFWTEQYLNNRRGGKEILLDN